MTGRCPRGCVEYATDAGVTYCVACRYIDPDPELRPLCEAVWGKPRKPRKAKAQP